MTAQHPDLSSALRELLTHAASPGYERWHARLRAAGSCSHPVRLTGEKITARADTGEVIETYTTMSEPGGYLLTACGNRRAAVCPTCSAVYRADPFHLIRAGLVGGKGIPENVRGHPRLFLTLTAPSFGSVYTRRTGADGRVLPCRPRRDTPTCRHCCALWCTTHHDENDQQVGQPLCLDCYDYTGAVLWNAHAGQLWQRFTIYLRRRLAASAGIPRSRLPTVLRVSFAKVAEFQARGLVHFHALIRLDGPTGSTTPPPPWAICALLADVIPAAARDAAVTVPAIAGQPARDLRWGTQIDLQPVHPADGCADGDTTEAAVAGYVAKGADAAGTVNHRIRHPSQIAALAVTDHARRMIETCWRLGGRPDYASLNLRRWVHMLGFRGHFTTKSRRYSTTLTALRQARADHRAQHARTHRGDTGHSEQPTASVGTWHYAGSGYTPAEDLLATSIRAHIRTRPPSSDDDPAT